MVFLDEFPDLRCYCRSFPAHLGIVSINSLCLSRDTYHEKLPQCSIIPESAVPDRCWSGCDVPIHVIPYWIG